MYVSGEIMDMVSDFGVRMNVFDMVSDFGEHMDVLGDWV